jgi:hypothetical protein
MSSDNALPQSKPTIFQSVRDVLIFLGPFAGLVLWISQRLHINIPSLSYAQIVLFALLLHCLTIILLVCFPPKLPHMQETAEFHNAIAASRQFITFWLLVWAAWFALYATWLFCWRQVAAGTITAPIHAVLDVCNMLSGAFFLLCYFSMVLRSEPPKEFGWYRVVVRVLVFYGAIVLLEWVVSASWPLIPVEEIQGAFHWIEGLACGIALALFVGRLDSRFINSPRWLVAALYSYAVIQLSYGKLEGNDADRALTFLLITSVALGLKVLLYWRVAAVVASGDLTYYMFECRKLFETGSDEKRDVLARLFGANPGP